MKFMKATIILLVLTVAIASCETSMFERSAMAHSIDLPSQSP